MEHLSPIFQKQLRKDGLCFSCREALKHTDQSKNDDLCQACRSEKAILKNIADIAMLRTLQNELLKRMDELQAKVHKMINEGAASGGDKGTD